MTSELLKAADGAWCVSLTDIDADGPLASPGARRLITLVDGTVVRLLVDGAEHVLEVGRPLDVAGGADVTATLPEGPARVLEVVASDAVEAFVTVLELGRTSTLPLAADQAALVLQGRAVTQGGEVGAFGLVAGPVELSGRCTLAVITLQARGV